MYTNKQHYTTDMKSTRNSLEWHWLPQVILDVIETVSFPSNLSRWHDPHRLQQTPDVLDTGNWLTLPTQTEDPHVMG